MQYAFEFEEDFPHPPRARGPRPGRSFRANEAAPFLPGLAPVRIDRLFLALRPDDRMMEDLRRQVVPLVVARDEGRGRWRKPELLHVTLAGLSVSEGVPPALSHDVGSALGRLSHPAVTAIFDRVVRFDASKAVVLTGRNDPDEVPLLARRLRRCLIDDGIKVPAAAMVSQPHMTLLYSPAAWQPQFIAPVEWRFREFFLIHSRYGLSRHEALGRWPLRGE